MGIDYEYATKLIQVLKKDGSDKCPHCGNRLYFRKQARGFVCKNWKCEAYWKYGKGEVFATVNSDVLKRLYNKNLEQG